MPTERVIDAGPKVAVVGNLCWDVIVRGLPALPRWGEEVEGDDNLQAPGGQAFNVAAALAALGAQVTLVGAVGADAAGEQILAAAAALGIATKSVTMDRALPTALTAALVRADGERAFASDFGCQREWGAEQILEQWESIHSASLVCVAGLFNIPGLPVADTARLLRRVREAGVRTGLDTGWDPLDWPDWRRRETREMLAQVDVFMPNLDEARALTGIAVAEGAAVELLADGPGTVVVKCGAAGSVGISADGRVRAGTLDVAVRDAVGAGDTFDAGFLLAGLEGQALGPSLALATAAAGTRVSRDTDTWPDRATAESAAPSVGLDPW